MPKTRSRDWTTGERRASHGEKCPSSLLCQEPCALPSLRTRTDLTLERSGAPTEAEPIVVMMRFAVDLVERCAELAPNIGLL